MMLYNNYSLSKSRAGCCWIIGIIYSALTIAAASSLLVAEAFSITLTKPPATITTTNAYKYKMMSINHNRHNHHSVVAFGSLRDLVESSASNNADNNNMDDKSSNVGGADDFNKLLNFSRSKFAETKLLLRSSSGGQKMNGSRSGSGGGDEDDERGLHSDRLSTFSFATNTPKSQSQGGGSTVAREDIYFPKDGNDNNMMSDTIDNEKDFGTTTSSSWQEEETTSTTTKSGEVVAPREDYAADNFNSMIGTFYSKQKFPSRTKGKISDDMDEKGLHSDRLSTFSFSSANTFSFETRSPNSQSEGSSRSSTSSAFGGEKEKEEEEKKEEEVMMEKDDILRLDENDDLDIGEDTTPRKSTVTDNDTMLLLADDFNSMVGTFYSKQKFPSRTKGKLSDDIMDEKGLHSDRLSTFSFSSTQPKLKTTNSPPILFDGGALLDDTLSSISDDRSVTLPLTSSSPTTTTSSHPTVNHNDRLGTFSFASTDPRSGSTSGKGTSSSSPLASASDSKIVPPPSRPKESNDSNQVLFASPQKGSLSSIASSVSIKSRNDRIKDIKDATDPKLLHPDGMNVPRLNSKGDVMTLSSTGGRLNIFQRIDNVKQVRDESDNVTSAVADENYDRPGDCFIGFDLGTSGARMSIVEKRSSEEANRWNYVELVTEALAWSEKMQYDDANAWKTAIHTLLSRVRGDEVMTRVKSICISGTSASCLLLNRDSLDVARPARMYNYDILSSLDSAHDDSPARRVMKLIDHYVPERHTARATTGSLAKLLLWNEVKPLIDNKGEVEEVFCHQSDYVSMSLIWEGVDNDEKKCRVVSDWHNCLKLGYDVQHLEFPSWMYKLLEEGANIPDPMSVLPSKVISPGEPFGIISPIIAATYGLPSNVVIVGGTTDSNAAFFASAGTNPEYGTVVTSLGSTMAIKMLSKTFVEDASRGVYSHRFPIFGNSGDSERVDQEAWLIGGASNVGCAILRQEGFSNEELRTLSEEIDPNSDCSNKYYPLTKQGERFPVADSTKQPVLTPKPDSRKDYLHGILQGIGDVEREGYRVLGELGADPERPKRVLTAGGGAANNMWMSLRERRLQEICVIDHRVVVAKAPNTEASYGAALLAAASFEGVAVPASSIVENEKYAN